MYVCISRPPCSRHGTTHAVRGTRPDRTARTVMPSIARRFARRRDQLVPRFRWVRESIAE